MVLMENGFLRTSVVPKDLVLLIHCMIKAPDDQLIYGCGETQGNLW